MILSYKLFRISKIYFFSKLFAADRVMFAGRIFSIFAPVVMKYRRAAIIFSGLMCWILGVSAYGQTGINKDAFFNAMAGNSVLAMEQQLKALKNLSTPEKEAFEGAMQMRRSATIAVPAKRLSLFRQGHRKLETAIGRSPENAEYRFLRLMVQENAPRSLGYNKNIDEDSRFIKDHFRSMPAVTRQHVTAYSKKPGALQGLF
jgi:hypothetical protein